MNNQFIYNVSLNRAPIGYSDYTSLEPLILNDVLLFEVELDELELQHLNQIYKQEFNSYGTYAYDFNTKTFTVFNLSEHIEISADGQYYVDSLCVDRHFVAKSLVETIDALAQLNSVRVSVFSDSFNIKLLTRVL